MAATINGREITPQYCEMVTKLGNHKDIGGYRYYRLASEVYGDERKNSIKKAAKDCGYYARVVDDNGPAIYIRKNSIKNTRK